MVNLLHRDSSLPVRVAQPRLTCLAAIFLMMAESVYAREFYFAPDALDSDVASPVSDLSIFSNPKAQLPGKYPTHIRLNKRLLEESQVAYLNGKDGSLEAQLTPAMLRKWGVKIDDYPELAALPPDTPLPHPPGWYIPASSSVFDFTSQTLDLSFPQESIEHQSTGYIAPSRWDNGVPVVFSDYIFSGRETTGPGDSSNSQYLNMRSGVNLGGWRARNYSTWSDSGGEKSWQTIASWLQHDIRVLKAQFVGGQSSTRGEVFDSIQYSGINLASDEEMLPASERGFAPVIRGTAMSNAQVTIKQNGYVIYQSTVSPGAFEIRDLYATSSSGDMEVTIKEADGTEHQFTQASSSVALMQRPSHLRFETTVGRYRADNESGDSEPMFAQSSAIYGVNNRLTLYGGATFAENYSAAVAGAGVNLGRYGSLSADVTAAQTRSEYEGTQTGQSWRLMYTSNIAVTGTYFTLASYRYSSRGYYSFADANHLDNQDIQDDWRDSYNKRNRMQLSVNQPFGDGTFYLNGYQQNYWGTHKKERSVNAGASYQFQHISYHMNLSWNDSQSGSNDRILSVGISIPLNDWLPGSWANYDISNTKGGATTQNLGLNGTLLDDRSLNYSLQQSHSKHPAANSSNLSATWRAPFSNLNAGYHSASDRSQQLSYGVSGAVVAHPHGVTLSQPLGDQFAIINADGASGLQFQNQYGIRTDWWGNAIIPSLSPYQENRIGLNTTALPDDVDSSDTAVTVIPSRNAAVEAHFSAHTGYRVLLTLVLPGGDPVPFGALALTTDKQSSGIVDDQGLLYLSGLQDNSTVEVQWGATSQQRCITTIKIPSEARNAQSTMKIKMLNALCQPGSKP